MAVIAASHEPEDGRFLQITAGDAGQGSLGLLDLAGRRARHRLGGDERAVDDAQVRGVHDGGDGIDQVAHPSLEPSHGDELSDVPWRPVGVTGRRTGSHAGLGEGLGVAQPAVADGQHDADRLTHVPGGGVSGSLGDGGGGRCRRARLGETRSAEGR